CPPPRERSVWQSGSDGPVTQHEGTTRQERENDDWLGVFGGWIECIPSETGSYRGLPQWYRDRGDHTPGSPTRIGYSCTALTAHTHNDYPSAKRESAIGLEHG